MKIATWNVNSVKARLPHLIRWLAEAAPDVVMLQELKCQTTEFPQAEIEAAGYHMLVLGQKSYNGVAMLSRQPLTLRRTTLPGDDEDTQARYIEATSGEWIFAGLYLPNGNPVDTEKYPYKLAWMDRLVAHARDLLAEERPLAICGDYNICPTDADVYDPVGWREDALCRLESRAKFRTLVHLGLTDAFRVYHRGPQEYSFWDYQAGRWPRGEGLRIDHLLLSPHAADRLTGAGIDRDPRGWERASDHTPVWCELAD